MPGEASASKLIYEAEDLKSAELATSSFGQGFNVTMIQMAAGMSSLINGGYYYQPHVVKEIRDADGNLVKNISTEAQYSTISASTSDFITEALIQTVEDGTGHYVALEGYTLGGKTGTAEKLPRGSGEYVISFASFVQTDEPELLLYVVIDNPGIADKNSSMWAQLLSQEIWKELLPYYNLFSESDEDYISETDEAYNPYEDDSINQPWIESVEDDSDETDAEGTVWETEIDENGEVSWYYTDEQGNRIEGEGPSGETGEGTQSEESAESDGEEAAEVSEEAEEASGELP